MPLDCGAQLTRAPRILMVCPISGSRGKEESSPSPPPPHRPDPPRRPQPPPDPPVPHLGRPSIMLLASGRGPPPPLRLAGKQFSNRLGGGPPSASPGAADSIATKQDKQQAPKTKPNCLPSLPFPSYDTRPPRRAGSRLAGDVTKLPLPPALRRFSRFYKYGASAFLHKILPKRSPRIPPARPFRRSPSGSLFLYLAAAAASPAPVLNPRTRLAGVAMAES
jgi:hypothetical protein